MVDQIEKANRSMQLDPIGLTSSDVYLTRTPFIHPSTYHPDAQDASKWRTVASEPVNKLARRLIQREVSSLNWEIISKTDEPQHKNAALYYTNVYANYTTLVSRLVKSMCEIPQGGAFEVGWIRPGLFGEGYKGTLAFVEYIDAGTLHPTASNQVPIVQIDPFHPTRYQGFDRDQIVRILVSPNDEFDRLWWQESPTMASFLPIEALSRIYTYYLKQLLDTPVAGILDMVDFSKSQAKDWAKSFRELLEGIDPIKIPILYEHNVPANWIPMGRNPAELSIQDQFKQFAELILGNYGLSTSDVRIFQTGTGTKTGMAMNRKISNRAIMTYAELIKDAIQSTLPWFLEFVYSDIDLEEKRTLAQIHSVEARTVQSVPALPDDKKLEQLIKWGTITVDVDLEEVKRKMEMVQSVALANMSPTPGQITQGEGKVRDALDVDAKQTASTNGQVFTKSLKSLVNKAFNIKAKYISPQDASKTADSSDSEQSNYGKKKELAQTMMEDLLEQVFQATGDENITKEQIKEWLDVVYTQFPSLNQQINKDPMEAKSELARVGHFYFEAIQHHHIEKAVAKPASSTLGDGKKPANASQRQIVQPEPELTPEPAIIPDDEEISDEDEDFEIEITESEEELRARIDELLDQSMTSTTFFYFNPDLAELGAGFMDLLKLAYEDGMLASTELVQEDMFERGEVESPFIDLDFNVVDEDVIKLLEDTATLMVRNIGNGTKYYLKRLIIEGAMSGFSIDVITDTILRELFLIPDADSSQLGRRRIRSIVTTELNRADSMGRLEQMNRLGLKSKLWLTRGEKVCPICLGNEAEGPVPLDFVYSDVFSGTLSPPGHPGTCHCTLGAVEEEITAIANPRYWTGG